MSLLKNKKKKLTMLLRIVWFTPLDLPIYADKLLKGENQSILRSDIVSFWF